jgi:hypothetical protein
MKRIILKAWREDKLPSQVAQLENPEEVDYHYLYGDICFSWNNRLYFFDDSPIAL